MTSLQAPPSSSTPLFLSSSALPAARQRRDSSFTLFHSSPVLSASFLSTPTLAAAPSPALLSYSSPFYSASSIFQPLQSPNFSPLPPHPPILDISTPTQLTLTPSTSAASSAPTADVQLPPSALSSSSSSASSSSSSSPAAEQSDSDVAPSPSSGSSHSHSHSQSLLYASSSFPFNSHQAAILTHHEDAMLAAADDDDDDDDDSEESLIGRKKKSISLLSHIVDGDAARSPLHSSALELMEETPSTPNSRPSSPSCYSSSESEASRDDDHKQAAVHTSRAGRVSKPSARNKRHASPARTPRAKKEKLSTHSHISSTASTSSEQSDTPSTPTSVASQPSHSYLSAPTVMTAAEMAKEQTGGSGLSCHQCKTRKQLDELYTCGNYERKKRATGEDKKTIKPCRKKYCARCLPEKDTRVLTNSGFLFLADIEARIEAKQPVLYACYDKSTQSIVYRPGQTVLVEPPTHWVDFTQVGTRCLWDAASDDYGSTAPASGVYANRITLRTTPDHDMYVQLCTGHEKDGHESYEPRLAGGAPIAPHKQTARELAPGYQCDCDTAGRVCTHGYSHYRMYTGAASGLHQPADIISMIDNDDIHSPVAALGLHSKDELDAFLELFGYWLGHGTLSHGTRADAVCFAPGKDSDCVYLLGLLARLHLERGQHFTSSESESRLVVRIIEPRWFRFFDDEFGVKYSKSRHYDKQVALLKQGMHNTQLSSSTASPVSSTRALSVSASSSFSLNASVVDYRSNDDMSLLGADPVVDEEQDKEEDVASANWLPGWVLFRLNAEQLRLVIEGLRQADGSSAADDKAVHGEHKLCTSSVGFRDQLIHACMHAGYSAYFELNTAAGEVLGYEAVPYDSWRVCYSEAISELLPAQDVRFDGSPCRVREQSAAMSTQPADLYDQQRDGRVWCVDVQHDDHLIFVQRAHRNASSVVTKVGRTLISGNCLAKFYGEQPPARRENGTTVLDFECPSCRLICQCAACRKRQMLADGAAGGAGRGRGLLEAEAEEKADGGQVEDVEADAAGTAEGDMMVDEHAGDAAMS